MGPVILPVWLGAAIHSGPNAGSDEDEPQGRSSAGALVTSMPKDSHLCLPTPLRPSRLRPGAAFFTSALHPQMEFGYARAAEAVKAARDPLHHQPRILLPQTGLSSQLPCIFVTLTAVNIGQDG
ncbi:hypothetical protein SKAU_G00315380 [Synaphobranchus kaupii]|uniref:Uncharacterized protein n=1 Tax=Synaphobranchus kaupii TaxID=118154 RepID=A0A9Q1ESK2_SYNKA|nr:hypothetical protein SKAU_G00315380 [Synaphobranchus kaupii]